LAQFSGALANACALSDLRMRRLLRSFDDWAARESLAPLPPVPEFPATSVPRSPDLSLNLNTGRIRTVICATGFRPDFSFVKLPVFDRKGALRHACGVVGPGLYVLGLPFQIRRKSALIDGVGQDAQALANHILERRKPNAA
jgi:putative flavoprotein involved in K+ transport